MESNIWTIAIYLKEYTLDRDFFLLPVQAHPTTILVCSVLHGLDKPQRCVKANRLGVSYLLRSSQG